jgi:predicted phosphodiesterase
MRVAALYDIHANLPALEAVIEEIRREEVDRIVVGGDVVPGPMPRETLDCLLGLDIPVQFIQGNCEVAVLAELAGRDPYRLPEMAREAVRWSAHQLDPEHAQLFAGWPKTLVLEIGGLGGVLFCHGTPRNENECFTRLTPADRLRPVFAGIDARVVVCGHTHMQFDRMIGTTRVVNAGSVGMPFGLPGAYWLVLGPGMELRRTHYDLARAAERVRGTSYPQAEDFATRNVLQPPSEQDMLEAFGRVELK